MPDSTLSQAIREAYASAPAAIIYHTMELRHPAFTAPIRVVRDTVPLTAALEVGAPVDGGSIVTFVALAFNFKRPEVSSAGIPQITIEMDNADRAIVTNIEASQASRELVHVTYREYISTDLSGPQNNPPLSMTIMSATATLYRVSAVAGFPNLMNKRFPAEEYSAERFPGLLR